MMRAGDVLSAPPGIAGPTQLVVGDWERDVITAAPTAPRMSIRSCR